MITSMPLYQRLSLPQLIDKIDWIKAQDKYVLRDPNVRDSLLYLPETRYHKMISSLSEGNFFEVLACPGESRTDVLRRFDLFDQPGPKGKTPHINDWLSSNSKLFPLISGWVVKESMINFKRNFELFIPIYYSSVLNWLGLRRSNVGYKGIWKLSMYLSLIKATRGINQVITILKISAIATNQYIAGTPLKTTQQLGQRIKLIHGLPALLPPYLRKLIREKNLPFIRVVTTILHCYKGIHGIYKSPDLSSITAPAFMKSLIPSASDLGGLGPMASSLPFTLDLFEDWSEVDRATYKFWIFMCKDLRLLKNIVINVDTEQPPIMVTAGPNHSISMLGTTLDAFWHLFTDRSHSLEKFSKAIRSVSSKRSESVKETVYDFVHHHLREFLRSNMEKPIRLGDLKNFSVFKHFQLNSDKIPFLKNDDSFKVTNDDFLLLVPFLLGGKLSLKYEAAGKVRVFAITDYWTQWALKPLHEFMFRVLEKHPSDATFDQIGAVKAFANKGHTYIASFDLKSATDLIPRSLYERVFTKVFTSELTSAWLGLLVNRSYYFSDKGSKPQFIKYSRGQPMGALSSWASLAIVHHFLVFLAASRVGKTPFYDYLILGDDIVIADKAVAGAYQKVCQDYGVTIGLPKSYVSSSSFFQFASQDMIGKDNVSPISIKEALAVSGHSYHFGKDFNLAKRMEWIRRGIEKEFIKGSFSEIVRYSSTSLQWKRISSLLTKGILDPQASNVIALSLLSDSSFKNNVSVNQLIASLRGDIGLFTNSVKYSPTQQRQYIDSFIALIRGEIRDKLVQLSNSLVSKPLKTPWTVTKEIYIRSMLAHNGRITEDFVKFNKTYTAFNTKLSADLTEEQWLVLFRGPDIDPLISSSTLGQLIDARRELNQLMARVELVSSIVACLDSKVPYRLKFHLTLLNQMLVFEERGVKS